MANYNKPHEKRQLRELAVAELHESGLFALDSDTWLKGKNRGRVYCTWKLKLMEWAKTGKLPRSIVDLGVNASLAGFMLMEYLKICQSECPIYYKGGVMYFCKSPKREVLKKFFNELNQLPWRYMFLYFSDDSVLAYWYQGKPYYHNIDISKCDASHTEATFTALREFLPPWLHSDFKCLRDQCAAPLRVVSTWDRNKRVELRPHTVKSYSGATPTTAINNVANTTICMAIADLDEITPFSIVPAAETCGYIVTGEQPIEFEKVQFLKHSPVRVGDEYEPLLNLGVFLRLMGSCKMDLPGRGDLLPRALEFQASLVKSAYPTSRFTLVNMMLRNLVNVEIRREISEHVEKLLQYKVEQSCEAIVHFSDEEICKRYDVPCAQFINMSNTLGNATYGQEYRCDVSDAILRLDYDMDPSATEDPMWDGLVHEPRHRPRLKS